MISPKDIEEGEEDFGDVTVLRPEVKNVLPHLSSFSQRVCGDVEDLIIGTKYQLITRYYQNEDRKIKSDNSIATVLEASQVSKSKVYSGDKNYYQSYYKVRLLNILEHPYRKTPESVLFQPLEYYEELKGEIRKDRKVVPGLAQPILVYKLDFNGYCNKWTVRYVS